MESKIFEPKVFASLSSYLETALNNTLVRISQAQKGDRNNILSSQTYNLASLIAGARVICNNLDIDDYIIKNNIICSAKKMYEPLTDNEIQSTVVNSFNKGINNPNILNRDNFKFDEKMKLHIRLIDYNPSKRYIFKPYSSLSLRNSTSEDIANIEKIINKRFSIETFNKLGIKISDSPYGIVFSDSRLITYNPCNLNKFLVLEGRTDFVTAVEMGLDNSFGLISRFNKEQTIELSNGNYYFLLDKDDTFDHITTKIVTKEIIKFTCLYPADNYKDLSDWYFKKDEASDELMKKIKSAELIEKGNDSNFSNPSKISNFSNNSNQYSKNHTSIEIFNGLELQNKEFKELEHLVENILPCGYWILAGKPKHGKSFFALQLLLAISNGKMFLKHFPTIQGNVLYISLEDSEMRIRKRAELIQESCPDLILNENFFYTINHITLDDNGIELLKNEILKFPELKLIVIDTLGRVKENTPSNNIYLADYAFGAKIQNITKEFGVTIIAITHLRKNYKFNKKDDVFEEIMGSSGEISAADGQIVLHKIGKNSGKLFLRGRDIDEITMTIEFNSGNWEFIEFFEDDIENKSLTNWRVYFSSDSMNRKDLINEMENQGINSKTAYYRIKTAIKNGILKEDNGKIFQLT